MAPNQFLSWLSTLPASKQTCIECGAGNAEIAQFLADRFAQSYAVDIEPLRLPTSSSVNAVRADAGNLPFDGKSVDLIVSMQALHHFDIPKHLDEARRILRTHGIFAAFCWGEIHLPNKVRGAYESIFKAISPYWESERPFVLSGYKGLNFDGVVVDRPQARMKRKIDLDGLEEIIARWSAVQGAVRAGVEFPEPDLESFGIDEDETFEISWPLLGRVFRVAA